MIQLFLPFPPSVNRLWRSGKGHVYPSKRYAAWRQEAAQAVSAAWSGSTMLGHVSVEIRLYGDSRRRWDIDNRAKAVLDLLEAQHEQLGALQASIQQLTQVAAHGAHAQREGLEVLKDIADGQTSSDGKISAPTAADQKRLGEPGGGRDLKEMNVDLEKAVSGGFSEMSRAMETAFIGYAQLLRRSMAVHENATNAQREGTNG